MAKIFLHRNYRQRKILKPKLWDFYLNQLRGNLVPNRFVSDKFCFDQSLGSQLDWFSTRLYYYGNRIKLAQPQIKRRRNKNITFSLGLLLTGVPRKNKVTRQGKGCQPAADTLLITRILMNPWRSLRRLHTWSFTLVTSSIIPLDVGFENNSTLLAFRVDV